MNVAVKFYRDVPNAPTGMPGDWPAMIIEDCNTSPGPEWVVMSLESYSAYRAEKMPLWDEYERVYQPKFHEPITEHPSLWQRFLAWIGVGG